MSSSTPTKENKTVGFIALSIFLLLIGIGLILQVIFVNAAIRRRFHDSVSHRLYMTEGKFEKNSTNYKKWSANVYKDTPIQEFSYYLHNITNPDEVLSGSWPKLEEIGPFKFLRFEYRTNPIFDSKSCIVSYTYKYKYQLLEDESANKNSKITFVNPNILSLFYNSIYSTDLTAKITAQQILTGRLNGSNLFMKLEAFKLFRGFNTPWLENLSPLDRNNISWYQILRDEMNITQYTGHCNKNDAGKIIDIDHSSTVNFWRKPEYINGTRETKVWPYNYIKKKKDLSVYSIPFFRQVDYHFEKKFIDKGVTLLRFRLSNTTLLSNLSYPPNNQYYQNGQNGLINLTMRTFPNPAFSFLSHRNFHKAPYYYNKYGKPTGLVETPIEDINDNDIYLDIQAKSGVVFRNRLEFMSSFLLYKPQTFNSFPGPFSRINSTECYVAFYSLEIDMFLPNRVYKLFRQRINNIRGFRLFSNYLGTFFGFIIICCVVIFWGYKYTVSSKEGGTKKGKYTNTVSRTEEEQFEVNETEMNELNIT